MNRIVEPVEKVPRTDFEGFLIKLGGYFLDSLFSDIDSLQVFVGTRFALRV